MTGGASYYLPLSSAGSLRLAADANYQSSYYVSALNRPQDRSPGQAYVNSTITWTTPNPHVDVALSIRNVLNTSKQVASVYNPSIGAWSQNFPDPRTSLLTLRFTS